MLSEISILSFPFVPRLPCRVNRERRWPHCTKIVQKQEEGGTFDPSYLLSPALFDGIAFREGKSDTPCRAGARLSTLATFRRAIGDLPS